MNVLPCPTELTRDLRVSYRELAVRDLVRYDT